MKKWRLSKRRTFEEIYCPPNGVFIDVKKHLSRPEYLRLIDENELMVVEFCEGTLEKGERPSGRCQGRNNRIHSQSS
ncbi:unnamed protein product [Menidia menidia]|uniref:(Atlantic silverside) hypothetical protein n=1 Tax=Menidia menidia TaxID=238744 RepID=A0A8S4B6N8_9TELE|nr:unnamed protein product [Menidia menidia]